MNKNNVALASLLLCAQTALPNKHKVIIDTAWQTGRALVLGGFLGTATGAARYCAEQDERGWKYPPLLTARMSNGLCLVVGSAHAFAEPVLRWPLSMAFAAFWICNTDSYELARSIGERRTLDQLLREKDRE